MEEIKEHLQIDFEKIHPKHRKHLDEVSDKIRNEVMDLITSIPFIYNLVRSDRKKVAETPKDKQGKVIVNITEPHIFENMDFFRERALYFKKHNQYTDIYPNKHPNSEWMKFWTEEQRRCLEGYIRPDGEWITGEHYWYLNYCPILTVESEEGDTGENVAGVRTENFPEFWDGDYLYFHYRRLAREKGLHCNVLKTRRRGYSYKGAAVMSLPYFHMRNQKCYAIASEGEYLYVDGLLNDKTWNMLSFIDNNTPWTQPRDYKDTDDHKRASYKDPETKTERGRKNEIIGVTLKNNTQKARGKAGINVLWEEYGVMPDGLTSWTIALGSMKQGRKVYGQMCSFGTGGCLTANNKVFNKKGELLNIQDLNKEKGIIGFNQEYGHFSFENITYWQPPTEKECIKITTNTGRWIECSLDHPILTGIYIEKGYNNFTKKQNRRLNKFDFFEAEKLKLGDNIAVIDEVPLYGKKKVKDARLIGMLIGDGSYGKNSSVKFFNADEELNNFIELNYNFSEELGSRHTCKDGRTFKTYRIRGFSKVLREHKIFEQTKTLKTLPKDIHTWNKDSICEFIGGLFDTDGYVNIRNNPHRKNKKICEISVSQCQIEILLELQLLLQKLGIHGSIRKRLPRENNPKDKNPWYEFVISDSRSLLRFTNNIKLLIQKKQERLNEILKYNKTIIIQRHYKGLRTEKVTSIEKVGIKPVYNLTASATNTYLGNGIVTHNTAGTAFEAMETLFYRGDSFDILMLDNVFDKAATGSKCALYIGEYLNREFCYDKNGNSFPLKALVEIVTEWKKLDPVAITQFKADYSITPQDACLKKEGTIFPVVELKECLSNIIPNYRSFISEHYLGELFLEPSGLVVWKNSPTTAPIHEFPIKDNKNKQGAIEIFKPPVTLNTGGIPHGRYIAGCDPYDDDSSSTNSLGSLLVLDMFTDEIVCEYTGRPHTAEEFYQNVLKILKYYNATCLYESFNKGLFAYMDKKRCLYLLADNPKILKQMDYIKGDFHGNKSKGYPPSKPVNSWGRRLAADWLVSAPMLKDEDKPDLCNMHKLRSIGLIRELIGWNSDGNFDRVSALQALMIYREERSKYVIPIEEEVDFNDYFMRNYKPTRERLNQLRIKYGTKK